MKNSLVVNEIFHSIDGEGKKAGELATFIRLTGCNLRCSYCDTAYAFSEGRPMTIEEIARQVRYHNTTLTGGEPLCQDVHALLEALPGHSINIETNGSIAIAPYFRHDNTWFTVDYKCTGSAMSEHMLPQNFLALRRQDVLKFVVSNQEDLEQARHICQQYAPVCPIYISPVFGKIEGQRIVQYMEHYELESWRLQLQLHKYIWPPDMRGV